MKKDRDLTVGNPFGLILSFSVSMIIGNVFQQLYTIVDSIIIGKRVGALGLAAIGGTDWLIFLVNGFLIGLIQGFSVLLGNKYGEKNEQAFDYYYKKARVICIVISVLFVVLLLSFSGVLLSLISTKEEAFDYAQTYVNIIFGGIPFLVFYQFFAATLRSRGNSRIPLVAMTISSLCNIVLDLLFICVFDLGIAGAALGTIMSEALVMVICGYHVLKNRKDKTENADSAYNKGSIRVYRELLVTGTPMALQSVITAIGGLIVISSVNQYDISFLTGYTIAGKIYALLEIAASSYGLAVVAYVSQNYGAKKFDRIHAGVRASLLIGITTAIMCSFIMIFFGVSAMKLFVDADSVTADVFRYGRDYLFVLGLFYPLLYVLYIVRAALLGTGNTLVPMISSFGQLVMRVTCARILTGIIGCRGIYYGEVGAWILADIILIGTYLYTVRFTFASATE
ncbi:MATE family efflux transporter [Butyrivibrio sp. AC2005]|uniref:MATE family efflux transporter n=1 Tax=Butyrivibrio sp. AC2005 TaxID=1280672 RepID=UPI00040FEDA1|nr:MATE family efflux transporter [Butyrivibrio sp. AC2005]